MDHTFACHFQLKHHPTHLKSYPKKKPYSQEEKLNNRKIETPAPVSKRSSCRLEHSSHDHNYPYIFWKKLQNQFRSAWTGTPLALTVPKDARSGYLLFWLGWAIGMVGGHPLSGQPYETCGKRRFSAVHLSTRGTIVGGWWNVSMDGYRSSGFDRTWFQANMSHWGYP